MAGDIPGSGQRVAGITGESRMRSGGDVAEGPVLVELVGPDVAVADAAHGRLALGAQLELGHARAQRV